MKKKYILTAISLMVAYFSLLALLVYAESFSPDATITSLRDAVWYSVVTLTTVGYGDLSPVTSMGKIIGGVFLVMSTSLVAILLLMVVTFSRLWVRLRSSMLQSAEWFVFSSLNDTTVQLALSIKKNKTDAVLVFPECENKELVSKMKKTGALLVKGGIEDIIELKKDLRGVNLFFMEEDGYSNYNSAVSFSGRGMNIFCQSEFTGDEHPADITVFNTAENMARLYWRDNPLQQNFENVVLIGDNRYINPLLEQAIQVNLWDPKQSINYHVFASDCNFTDIHPKLSSVVSINEISDNCDSLIFYSTSFEKNTDKIISADRIIICMESDEANLEAYNMLTKYFAVKGRIHIRLSKRITGVSSFGSNTSMYTADTVMGEKLIKTAAAMHSIYLDSTGATGPEWEELPSFTRASNISAADHLLTKIRILLGDDSIEEINGNVCRSAYERYLQLKEEKADFFRQLEHMRWMRFHAIYNWTYSPQRNNSFRQHPSMLPYEKLDSETQAKDDYSWQLLHHMAEYLKK